MSKLSASKIYSEIENSLTKPIYVGQTMANDLFLKNWLCEEKLSPDSAEHGDLIQQFLNDYREKYFYDSVFLVSAATGTYYYYEGVNKQISKEDEHDIWYYDFIDSNLIYDLDVDKDEVNNDNLTVFVNCRVEGADGELLGVVGVGVKMSHLQELLLSYENDYGLNACLIDANGTVEIDSDLSNIETVNYFANSDCAYFKDDIIANTSNIEMHWYPSEGTGNCIITRYIKTLDWYIVVEKTTAQIRQILNEQFYNDLYFVVLITVVVMLLITFIISKYNKILIKTATTDEVTKLPNSRMFNELYAKNLKRVEYSQGVLFMFDIDSFKAINDAHGHLFGNKVLLRISEIVQMTIGKRGIVSRWGGDEFVGVIYANLVDADAILREIMSGISEINDDNIQNVTISIGVTRISSSQNIEELLRQADKAMYKAKDMGRNRIEYFGK
ncbi:MAG: diguanylate cyclase [Oscillospiraceae bacterium]